MASAEEFPTNNQKPVAAIRLDNSNAIKLVIISTSESLMGAPLLIMWERLKVRMQMDLSLKSSVTDGQ